MRRSQEPPGGRTEGIREAARVCPMLGSQEPEEGSSPLVHPHGMLQIVPLDLHRFAALDHSPFSTKKSRHVIV
jgi:hypothetical protein